MPRSQRARKAPLAKDKRRKAPRQAEKKMASTAATSTQQPITQADISSAMAGPSRKRKASDYDDTSDKTIDSPNIEVFDLETAYSPKRARTSAPRVILTKREAANSPPPAYKPVEMKEAQQADRLEAPLQHPQQPQPPFPDLLWDTSSEQTPDERTIYSYEPSIYSYEPTLSQEDDQSHYPAQEENEYEKHKRRVEELKKWYLATLPPTLAELDDPSLPLSDSTPITPIIVGSHSKSPEDDAGLDLCNKHPELAYKRMEAYFNGGKNGAALAIAYRLVNMTGLGLHQMIRKEPPTSYPHLFPVQTFEVWRMTERIVGRWSGLKRWEKALLRQRVLAKAKGAWADCLDETLKEMGEMMGMMEYTRVCRELAELESIQLSNVQSMDRGGAGNEYSRDEVDSDIYDDVEFLDDDDDYEDMGDKEEDEGDEEQDEEEKEEEEEQEDNTGGMVNEKQKSVWGGALRRTVSVLKRICPIC